MMYPIEWVLNRAIDSAIERVIDRVLEWAIAWICKAIHDAHVQRQNEPVDLASEVGTMRSRQDPSIRKASQHGSNSNRRRLYHSIVSQLGYRASPSKAG
jgi:hypothetical protein